MNRFGYALGTLALAGFVMSAAVAEDAVVLTRKATKGEKTRYKMDMSGQVMGADFTVSGFTVSEVIDVKDNGDYTVSEKDEDTKLTIMGMEMAQPAQPPVVSVRTLTGRLKEYKVPDGEANAVFSPAVQKTISALSEPLFSDKPVKTGDNWTVELDSPLVPAEKIVAKTGLAGNEKVGAKHCRKVTQKADALLEAGGAEKLTSEATYWVSSRNGALVKFEITVKNVPTQFGAMSWTMKTVKVGD